MGLHKFIAALEISDDEIRFAVNRISFKNKTFMVVQKNRLQGNFIEKEQVVERERIIEFLNNSINDFEKNFRTSIESISLVVPDSVTRSKSIEEAMNMGMPRPLTSS